MPGTAPDPSPRPPLDRGSALRRQPDLLSAALADPATRVLDVAGDRLPVGADPGGASARSRALRWTAPAAGAAETTYAYLGRDDAGIAHVARLLPSVPDGATDWAGLREIGAWLAPVESELAMTAVGLARWHARHGFCPGCGAPTEPRAAGWVRRCTAEGSEHFPRTDPAVIVAIVDPADRLLLGRGPTFKQGWVSVLAGFVEPGETLEAAVVREMAEEVGLVVGQMRYVASQPWPFPASLMLGFTARASDDRLRPDPEELAEVAWYTRERLAADLQAGRLGIPGRLSIARRLIEDWYGGPLRQAREVGTIRTEGAYGRVDPEGGGARMGSHR